MVPGLISGKLFVLAITLNVGLMLKTNGCEHVDTFVHEMDHAADCIFDGDEGHGHMWPRCVQRDLCWTVTCKSSPIVQWADRTICVREAPPLLPGARYFAV